MPAIVPSTAHVFSHLIITKTLWGQHFCCLYFTAEETQVLGSVTLGSPWLVGEPRFEFGKSSPRGFFHLPCSWCQSGRSLRVTFKAPERLCQEEARTAGLSHAPETLMASARLLGGPHSAFSLKKLIPSGLWSPNKRPKRISRGWKWAIAISVLLKNGFQKAGWRSPAKTNGDEN